MPRLAYLPLVVLACCLAAPVGAQNENGGIAGGWRYNPELSTPLPPVPPGGERQRGGPGGGRPPGGGGGGRGGGMPGMGRGGPSDDEMRRLRVIRWRVTEPPASLVIVRDGLKVIVTDGDGRTVAYLADGRKEDRLTGDGEFSSRAKFEGAVLVIDEDFGGGVKLTTRVAPMVSENRRRLEVKLTAAGLPKRPGRGGDTDARDGGAGRGLLKSVTRVYEQVER